MRKKGSVNPFSPVYTGLLPDGVVFASCVYMRTNIVLNEELVKKAFLLAPQIKTKKDLVDEALKEFIQVRSAKKLEKLRGMDLFSENYDYKKMREER